MPENEAVKKDRKGYVLHVSISQKLVDRMTSCLKYIDQENFAQMTRVALNRMCSGIEARRRDLEKAEKNIP